MKRFHAPVRRFFRRIHVAVFRKSVVETKHLRFAPGHVISSPYSVKSRWKVKYLHLNESRPSGVTLWQKSASCKQQPPRS